MFSLRAYFLLLFFIYTNSFSQGIGYTRIDIPANTLILEKLILLPVSSSPKKESIWKQGIVSDQHFPISVLPDLKSSVVLPYSNTSLENLHPGYYLANANNNGTAIAVFADDPSINKYNTYTSWNIIAVSILLILLLSGCSIGYYIYTVRNNTLRQVNKNHELLFHIVAHDLRSPFNHYTGLGEILHELIQSKEYERLEKVGQEIEGTGRKLDILISNLLAWSFLPQHKKKIITDEIWLANIVKEILPIYISIAESKKIAIHTSIDSNAVVATDKSIFSLIVRNLIDNAIKHSPGGSAIFISAEMKSGTLVFSFKNEYGIDQQSHLKKIAFLFNQGRPLNSDYCKGSGLRFIKEFIEVVKGHIEISLEEKFVTWAVTLPCKV